MDELIYKRDAIKAICEDGTWLESQGCTEITMAERKQRDADIIESLPPVQPTITHEQAIDYLHETGWLQNHDRILTESKIVPPVQLKNGTLVIPLNESDFKSVKRIMLDNKPWCRTFYEDVPGEAHWIKTYTTADGEVYECDNCGVVWQFNDGGPEENEAFFCPKCGFKMERGDSE